MGLATGTKLGPYEIQSPLGAGGMGGCTVPVTRVWAAKLRIKGLPASFCRDLDRLRRFGGVAWNRDGKQMYFRDATGMLMSVDIQPQSGESHSGFPRQIFSAPGGVRPLPRPTDGILVLVQAEQGVTPPITLVVNWDAELKKLTLAAGANARGSACLTTEPMEKEGRDRV